MPAVVYLFDAVQLDQQGSPYHLLPLTRFFQQLLTIDEDGGIAFELLHGDLLLHNLAYSPSRVRLEHKPDGSTSIATHTSADRDLYLTLIWDFCDALNDRWHTTDAKRLTAALAKRDIYVLAASALSLQAATQIDAALQSLEAYLGAFELDPGNPVQHRVTKGGLIVDFVYRNRSLLFDPWASEDPSNPPPLDRHGDEWFLALDFRQVRYMDAEEGQAFHEEPDWPVEDLSPRGRRSREVVRQRVTEPHMKRLASELGTLGTGRHAREFDIETAVMPRSSDAVVEESKLVQYALNPESKDGASKAKFFNDVLGIGAQDWRHLAAQLKQGLTDARVLSQVRSGKWGIRYEVVTNVLGTNGAAAAVLSAWQVEPGQPPRFITAHPAPKELQTTAAPPPDTCIVSSKLQGKARWAELWLLADRAGTKAANAVVPTPMWVDEQGYQEGMFGGGRVIVPDARRDFARWLVKSGKGYSRRGHGAIVSTSIGSADRGRAYADAFAEVLVLNGIQCATEYFLD